MEKNITALFEINVPKIAKTLAKFASKDTIRPQYTYICIEPGRGFMTATDTRELRVINIEATGEWPEGARILVDPKHIAKIAGKTATVTVSEVNTAKCVEIEADGEIYTTEHTRLNFPDVKRVIPPKENRKAIRLTPEGIEALKTICKLSKGNYITLSVVEGDTRLIVCDEVKDYSDSRTAFSIELAAPAEQTIAINLSPEFLTDCLTGCNGVILVDEPYKPIMFEGEADATILMPMCVNDRDAEFVGKVRDNSPLVGSTFAEDAAEVVKQLKEAAAELWQSILNFHKHSDGSTHFTPGNYSAKDIANRGKAKCGYYILPDNYSGNLEVKHGNISLTLDYSELFSTLSFWESATRSKKSVFAVGSVEEVTATVLEATGEGAAEKKMKLRKLGGNWYCDAKRTAKSYDTTIYYEINGVKFSVRRMEWDSVNDAEYWQKWVENVEGQIEKLLRAQASTNDKYYTAVLERIEAQQAATPAETPQISTESAETVNVSAEGEKREIITANCLYWDYLTQSIKERLCELVKVTNHLYYVDNGGEYVTIARSLNGVYWLQQGNAEIHRDAFNPAAPEYGEILIGLKAYQTVEEYLVEYDERIKKGWYENEFTKEIVKRITSQNPEPFEKLEQLPQPPKFAPQSRETLPTANYATPTRKRRQRANKRPNSAFRKFRTTRPTILRTSAKCSPANPPPIGRPQFTPHW